MENKMDLDVLLKQMATQHQPQLPSANLIWWRAQIARKLREKERIERPLKVMRAAAVIACTAVLLISIIAGRGQFPPETGNDKWLLVLLLMASASLASVTLFFWSKAKVDRLPRLSPPDFKS